jgi:hypothetical protein
VVLRGARIITMKGDQIIPNGDILVTDNRIVGIGARGSVSIPRGDEGDRRRREDDHPRASWTFTLTTGSAGASIAIR